jgi:hypothetical protein
MTHLSLSQERIRSWKKAAANKTGWATPDISAYRLMWSTTDLK